LTRVETVTHEGKQMAIVIRGGPREPGTHFATPPGMAQQVAVARWERGTVIAPHRHLNVQGSPGGVVEVLVIQAGIANVQLYSEDGAQFACLEMSAGDVVVLAAGTHGLEAVETVQAVLIRQGPFMGDGKVRSVN
jgi:hypothetical protein